MKLRSALIVYVGGLTGMYAARQIRRSVRLEAARNVLRNRPTMYRILMRNGTIALRDNAFVAKCTIVNDPGHGPHTAIYMTR